MVSQNTDIKAVLQALIELGVIVTPVKESVPTPIVAPGVSLVPTQEELAACLKASYQVDVKAAEYRHQHPAGCPMCLTCKLLYRKGSTVPDKEKHRSHRMYRFPDATDA